MARTDLEWLLEPVPPRVFLEQYLGRWPLYVHNRAGQYDGVFDRERLWAAMRQLERQHAPATAMRVQFRDGDRSRYENVTAGGARAALERGGTLCIDGIEAGDPQLFALAARLRQQLGYPGKVRFNCYYSLDGGGFTRHFDARIATTLQISGEKEWRYSPRPAVSWPRANAEAGPDGEALYVTDAAGSERWERAVKIDERELVTATLRPGDLLVLPAGTWHEARALGHSLALNLALEPLSFSWLLGLAMGELERDTDWRAVPPSKHPEAYVQRQLEALSRLLASGRARRRILRHWKTLVRHGHA